MTGLANDLNISETGFVSHNGAGIFHGRTLTAGTGITITNGTGVSGDPVISSTAASSDLHTARFIVASSTAGTGANYTTISAAIAAAQGTGINSTIFIQPGTYTENFTLPANINLTAYMCDSTTPNVTIVGNITCSDAGTRSISGINLQTNSAALLTVSGSAATVVYLFGCFLNCTNNTGITFSSSSSSSLLYINDCRGNLGTTGIGLFSQTSAGVLTINFSLFSNTGGSSTVSTSSAGIINLNGTTFASPVTMSSTSAGTWEYCIFNTVAQNATSANLNGGSISCKWCRFQSGTASALSIASAAAFLEFCTIASSNAAAIAGAGTLNFSNLDFVPGTTSAITVTTQIPFITSNDAINVKTPGSYPYTTVPQDGIILVDTSSARTITPLASPTTGQRHIIKDSVGTAGANNITVTPSGKNIDGAASYVINTNYGSITIVYNGSEWSVI